MAAFSTNKFTETNAPFKQSSGTFGGSASADANVLLKQISALSDQLSALIAEYNDFVNQVEADLATKQNTLTFDSQPTEDSTNPVTSNGVYEALQTVKNPLEVGSMIRWPYGATIPTGWHDCDGSPYDTTLYPKLLEVIGSGNLPIEYGSIIKMVES